MTVAVVFVGHSLRRSGEIDERRDNTLRDIVGNLSRLETRLARAEERHWKKSEQMEFSDEINRKNNEMLRLMSDLQIHVARMVERSISHEHPDMWEEVRKQSTDIHKIEVQLLSLKSELPE